MTRCPAQHQRRGGRESGDRIVECHAGDHEEADTGFAWSDPVSDDYPADEMAMTSPAFEVRARMAREWAERTAGGSSKLPWTVRQHFEQDFPMALAAIEAYRAGQAAAPDRLSALERDVIEKAKGLVAGAHQSSAPRTPRFQAFIDAVDALTDATPAAGQDGDDRG